MACDLQFTQGDKVKWKGKTKIFKFKAHPDTYPDCDFIIGFAGRADDVMTAVQFFSEPDSFKKIPGIAIDGLVLTEQGNIYAFNSLSRWLKMDEKYAAIGSGSTFALGAMDSGATPKEAVKAASKRDPYSGMGIKTLKF